MESTLYQIQTILGGRFFDFESSEDETCQIVTFYSNPKRPNADPDWELYVGSDGIVSATCFSWKYDSSVGCYIEREVVGFLSPYEFENSEDTWSMLIDKFQEYLREDDEAQIKAIADEQLAQLYDRLDKYGE